MRKASTLIALVALLLGAVASLVAAYIAVGAVEARAERDVKSALASDGITWTQVKADGLRVRLSGTAPNEARRFRALSVTGRVVDATRVVDRMEVAPAQQVEAPEFTLELLRNDDGVSMIGLIPAATAREAIARAVARAAGGATVTDMLDSASYPAPEGWQPALEFGLEALKLLPRAKISVSAGQVEITAIADSLQEKRQMETALGKALPRGVSALIDISAPRPVLTPFTLRFVIDGNGARFDACSADTPAARKRILEAARAAGLPGEASCIIGLGVPTPHWAEAVTDGIAALGELGGGTLTFSDADVTLIARQGTAQADFDRVVGTLDAALPEVFTLHSVLPDPPAEEGTDEAEGPPEFVATKSPEGLVQLRGPISDELSRNAAESYARSRFGIGRVSGGLRLDDDLPEGWPIRVLTGLEGLAELRNGAVVVQPDFVSLRGVTEDAEARDRVTRIFGQKLGDAQQFEIDITYIAPPEPEDIAPDPQQCVDEINALVAERKITFEPGSVSLQGDSLRVVGDIAEVLRDCPDVQIEIGGHTDSQGREEMNLQLSQQRADSVLNALLARRILTGNITARGYGESEPIADNDTEEGREANRRIEFKLIEDAAEEEASAEETGEDTAGEAAETDAAEAAEGADGAQDQTQQDAEAAADGQAETDTNP